MSAMQNAQTDRLHALDAVRAMALLLGIVLHACMSFLPSMREIGWPMPDDSPSDVLNAIFLWIHIYRMPLFFLMAGFFARLVVERRGLREFVRDRRKRIALPLVAGWLAVVPLTGGILYLVAQREGKVLFHPNIPPGSLLQLPLAHLWFLYVLLLVYVGFIAARWLITRKLDPQGRLLAPADACVAWLLRMPLGAFVLALPLAASLYVYPWWWVSLGIPTPDYSLIPNPPALVGYGTAFTVGWLMHRQSGLLLPLLSRRWLLWLLLACAWTGLCVWLGGTSMSAVIQDDGQRAAYALSYCTAIWCWVFAFIGAAMRFMPHHSPRWRYLADASYWMYLVHLPLVLGLQAVTMHWPVHWAFKITLILGVTTALLLLSYRYLVRGTFIGQVLNGRRLPQAATGDKGRREA